MLISDDSLKPHRIVAAKGPGIRQAPDDNLLLNQIRFEDQFDPATGMSIYTTAEHLCP